MDRIQHMAAMRCPKAVIHGADSAPVTPEVVDFMRERMEPGSPMIEPPEARHHLIVDQPLAFVSTLGALLSAGPGSPS